MNAVNPLVEIWMENIQPQHSQQQSHSIHKGNTRKMMEE